jgi:hypothetical protein
MPLYCGRHILMDIDLFFSNPARPISFSQRQPLFVKGGRLAMSGAQLTTAHVS